MRSITILYLGGFLTKILDLIGLFKKRIWSDSEELLMVRPAGQLPDEALHKSCDGIFKMVTEENVADCAEFEDPSHYIPVYKEMISRGDEIIFGYVNGKCGYRMHHQKSGNLYSEGHIIRNLSETVTYLDYAYCAPYCRGHGMHPESIYQFCVQYPQNTIYATVLESNKPALHNILRNNFQILSRLKFRNRFFHRSFVEIPLSDVEIAKID